MRRALPIASLILLSWFARAQGDAVPLWKTFYDSAHLYLNTDVVRAVGLFAKAENIAKNDLGIYDDNYLVILNGLGTAHQNARNFPKAEKCFREAVSIEREIYKTGDPRLLQSSCNLASLLNTSGDYREAANIYTVVFRQSKAGHQHSLFALSGGGLLHIAEAHDLLDSALLIAKEVLSTPFMASETGSSYEFRLAEGRILKRLKRYEESRKILESLGKELSTRGAAMRPLTRAVNIQLGWLDIETGLYGKAEKDLLQLYRSIKGEISPDAHLLTELTNALAYCYEKLGVYDKSAAYYHEALNHCVTGVGINATACEVIQNNIAGLYLKQGQFVNAIAEYESYILSFNSAGKQKDRDYLTALNNLATAYRQSDQYEKALGHFNEVYEALAAEGPLHDDLASAVINNIAVTYTMMGRFNEATTHFEQALQIKESIYGTESPLLLDLCGNLAVALWASGDKTKALPHFQRSLNLGLREVKYNFQNLTETEQVQFYQRQKENFERFNTLAVQPAGNSAEMLVQMFNNQLMLKSLTFFTNRKVGTVVKDRNDPELKKLAELKQARSVQLGHYYQTSLQELKELGISLTDIEEEIDSLDKVMRHRMSGNDEGTEDITWKEIQGTLQPDEVSVDILRFRKYDMIADAGNTSKRVKIGFSDSVYYAALITTAETTTSPDLVLLKNGRELETRFYSYHKNATRFEFSDSVSLQHYWLPLVTKIKGKEVIYITPDGVFRQINLNTIQDRDGKFVIEKYDLRTALNPAHLINARAKHVVDLSKVVLIGNPVFGYEQASVGAASIQSGFAALPGTQQELNEIATTIHAPPPGPTQFVRGQASEENLRHIKSPSVLHIATHGFFSIDVSYLNEQVKSDFLFHSGILLSGGKAAPGGHPAENDGIVTAYDILNLGLTGTDLVVLSACETGLGKNEYGEGIHGLQRSFMQAGARDLVISLWKVDDESTKNLMVQFYKHLANQKGVHDALRLAQLDMMQKVAHRRMWGGFVTISSD